MKLKSSIVLVKMCPVDEDGKFVSVCPFCKKQTVWKKDEKYLSCGVKCKHFKDQQITPSGQTLDVGYVLELD